MESSTLTVVLDAHRHVKENGEEYWMARDIQRILNYSTWQKFRPLIEKAIAACVTLDLDPSHHINPVVKPHMTSGADVLAEDYFLSRHGCYLAAMSGASSKAEIAIAQQYFAAQTIRQEGIDRMTEDDRRLLLRDRVTDANNKLAGAAKAAWVTDFPVFQNSGYEGMYRTGVKQVKRKKGIGEKEKFLDCIGRAELAANEFRITQTEVKLRNEQIIGQSPASDAHFAVGRKVRETMMEISKTKPEDLPRDTNLRHVEKERRKALKLAKKTLRG